MGGQKIQAAADTAAAADTTDPKTSQTHTAAHFVGANNIMA